MRFSLKQKSVLFVAVSTLVLLAAYAVISIQFLHQKTDNIKQARQDEAKAVAASIDPFLMRAGEKVQSVAALPGLVYGLDALTAGRQHGERDLASTLHYIFFDSDVFTDGVFLMDPAGRVLWSEPSDKLPQDSVFPAFALVRKDIASNSAGSDNSYIFSIASSGNTDTQILVSSPLVDRLGDTVGVLVGAIPIKHDAIAGVMERHAENQPAIQIIDSAGIVIDSTEGSRNRMPLPFFQHVLNSAMRNTSGLLDSTRDGVGTSIIAYAKLSKSGSGWLITIDQDRRTALAEATSLLVVLSGFGIGFIALAMAILFFVVRGFTEPIELLTIDARRIAAGDLSVRFASARTDEIGILAAALDEMKSKLKSSYDRLLISEKMSLMGQIVAGIAHELNNPLTIVMGHADLLMQEKLDPKVKGSLGKIHDGAGRASKIVGNLLTFARQRKPSRKTTDVNSVLLRTVELRAYELKVSNIQLVTDLAPIPQTMSDEHQLQQVFLNLIVNAEHAMLEAHKRGRLAISSSIRDEHIEISFEDDGPGISEVNLHKVFDPFFTTKEVGKGTGLGLSICQGIITEHGGRLTVSSTPGKGTRFVVELPIVLAAGKSVQAAPVAPVVVIRKKILVVDDEGHLRELFRELLSRDGHRIETATNGREALELIRRETFDLVITDIKMPEIDGIEFYRILKTDGSPLADHMIFVTGDLMNPETIRFLETTGRPWIPKPFEISTVRSAVNKALATRCA